MRQALREARARMRKERAAVVAAAVEGKQASACDAEPQHLQHLQQPDCDRKPMALVQSSCTQLGEIPEPGRHRASRQTRVAK